MAIQSIDVYLRAVVTPLSQGLRTAAREVDAFGTRMLRMQSKVLHEAESAARGMRLVGIGGAAAFALTVKAASDFEKEMRNVNSIAQMTEGQFRKTWGQVISLSREFPQSATDMARGLYDIESSGFHGAEAMSVLHASLTAASAGLTDTRTAARAIVSVMNAFGESAGDAGYVADVLFQTVNVGVVTFEELAGHMGQFIGLTAQAGISIEEVGAAYATMTRAGLGAAEASTSLARVVSAFVKPSDDLSSLVQRLGYDSAYAFLQQNKLSGSIEILRKVTGNSVPQLARLFREVRGLRGVLSLTSQEGELYNEVLATFADKSQIAGAATKAMNEQEKSLAHQMSLLRNAFTEAGISIGEEMLPAVKGVTNTLTEGLHVWESLPGPVKFVAVAFGGVTIAAIGLSGTLLILAPRITATRLAVEGLASKGGALGRSMAIASVSLGKLLNVAGAATILLSVASYADEIHDAVERLKIGDQQIGPLTEALVDLGNAGSGVDLNPILDDIAELGRVSQTSLSGNIKGFLQELGMWSGYDPNTDFAARFKDVDKALANLATNGHADVAYQSLSRLVELTNAWNPSKETFDEFVNRVFPQYAGAVAGVRTEATLAGKEVGRFGQTVGQTEADLEQAAEETKIFEESLKRLQKAVASFLDTGDAFSSIRDAQKAAHQRGSADRDYAEKVAEGAERIADAKKNVADAQRELDETRAEIPERRHAPTRGEAEDMAREADQIADANDRLTEAQQKYNETVEDSKKVERERREEYKETRVTLEQFRVELDKQVKAQEDWENNLIRIAQRGAPHAVLEALIDMGKEGADIVAQLANSGDAEFKRFADVMVEHAKRGGDGYGRELSTRLAVARVVATATTQLTVQDIITELAKIAPGLAATAPEVEEAARAIGYAVDRGVSPGEQALRDLGKAAQDALGRLQQAGGALGQMAANAIILQQVARGELVPIAPGSNVNAIMDMFMTPEQQMMNTILGTIGVNAQGNVWEPHDPMISYHPRLWAEPETGGEAYIPLSPTKRGRSMKLWADVGKIFGIPGFADGAVLNPAGRPGGRSGSVVNYSVQTNVNLEGATITRSLLDHLESRLNERDRQAAMMLRSMR